MFSHLCQLLFPPFCISCYKVQGHFICSECRREIQKIDKKRCLQCGSPSPSVVNHCQDCCHYSRNLDRVEALYLYNGAVIKIIHNLKYHQCGLAGKVLGKLLALRLKSFSPYAHADYIIPIPITARKERKRGYNQSGLLAERISSLLQIPLLDCLRKKKETPSQSLLSRDERLASLDSVFTYNSHKELLKRKEVILVDDVSTTGATLLEGARALKEEGKARKVYGAVVARQPKGMKTISK
ncbi:MAG: ComF family protein [Planctomycetota bacterium]|nr:MAG: ComF family protein [Planctomycetota bacterium]